MRLRRVIRARALFAQIAHELRHGIRAPAFDGAGAAFGGTAAAFLLLHVRGFESEDKALLPKVGRQRAASLGWLGRYQSSMPWSKDKDLASQLWDKLVVPRVLAAEYGVLPLFLYRPCEQEEEGEVRAPVLECLRCLVVETEQRILKGPAYYVSGSQSIRLARRCP